MSACQQIAEEEIATTTEQASTSSVTITTRASENTAIGYPVTIYAFGSDGKLVTSQILASASGSIRLSLGIGDYKIVAVAGVSDGYELPSSPSLSDVVTISDEGFAHSAMMMGKADFTVSKTGKEAQLAISMSYVVSSLSVSLENIPEDVIGVKVALSSFYTRVSLDGTYSGGGKTVTFDCEEEDDHVWKVDDLYLFPTDKSETIYSITFEYADKSETFAYTYPAALAAGSPFRFVGSYNGVSYIGGSLVVEGWGTPVDVNFTFGGSTSGSDSTNSGSGSNATTGSNSTVAEAGLPQVGEIWNNGIVVQVTKNSDTDADILLLSLDEWVSTTTACSEYAIAYASSTGLPWRMLTDAEAKSIKSVFNSTLLSTVNSRISGLPNTYDEISSEDGVRYLCLKGGVAYSFRFETSGSVTKAGSTKNYLLRLVREVHYQS